MSLLSLVHAIAGLVSVLVGIVILSLRKGDRRHRILGWVYVATMAISLVGILARVYERAPPFAAYAVLVLVVLAAAVTVSRRRRQVEAWRAWHGALMTLTLVGSTMAMASIFGGLAIGATSGPPFYRLFNAIIAVFTAVGLWLIATRPVIWGVRAGARELAVRRRYLAFATTASLLLIAAQWPLAYPG